MSYRTLQCSSRAAFPDDTGTYIVPPGHFFMMGDNRENSEDSRFRDVGFVPFENLIARAQLVFFSIDVRDAKRPRAVNYLAAPPNAWNIHLQTHDDLLLVVNAKYIFAAAEFADEKAYYKGQLGNVVGTAERTSAARDWTAGLAVYDISKPATPQRIGCWLMTSGTPGLSAARGLPNDIAGQAELAWQNVMNLLAKGRHGCGRYC